MATAKDELIQKLAVGKGAAVGDKFARYLLGSITREEFTAYADETAGRFEEICADLGTVSEATIQAVTMYLDR